MTSEFPSGAGAGGWWLCVMRDALASRCSYFTPASSIHVYGR